MKRWLLVGGATGWLLGWAGSQALRHELDWTPREAVEAAPAPAAARTTSRREYTESLAGRDIFNLGGAVSRKKKTTWSGPAEEVVLLATVVASEARDSSALIRLGEHTEGYGIGDSLSETITVVDIKPREVTVAYDSSLHTLYIHKPETGDHAPPSDDRLARISRAELSGLISERGAGLRVVPHKSDSGEVDGYRISGIRRKSLLHRLGAKNGDIVHRINGAAVFDSEELMKVYSGLEETEALTLDVTRRNKRLSLRVEIE